MINYDIPETPSTEEQIKELKAENQSLKDENIILTDCLLEISQIIYGGGE